MNDQALTLREMMKFPYAAIAPRKQQRRIRVISVTSGKGGVGKTNVVANLAHVYGKMGKKVLIIDGDFGLANLNILFGVDSEYSIDDVIHGNKGINDVLVHIDDNIKLLPSASGILHALDLSIIDRQILLDKIEGIDFDPEIVLLDTGAGIYSDVVYLNQAAHEVVLVTTPEPTSLTDAYAMMKVMNMEYGLKKFKLLVNKVEDTNQGIGVYTHLLSVTDKFLKDIALEYIGHIIRDRSIEVSVMHRKVFTEMFPKGDAARCVSRIAENLMQNPSRITHAGNMQFFWKTLLHEVRV